MNFLAHTFLAEKNDNAILGNVLGDFIKGSPPASFAPDIIRGIMLHRAIDTFTDSSSLILEARDRFPNNLRRYAGIVIDVFYDHFLAKDWHIYSPSTTLREHCDAVYNILANWEHQGTGNFGKMLEYILQNDLFYSYKDISGIERVLLGMRRRLQRRLQLAEEPSFSIDYLTDYYEQWQADFNEFMPQVLQFRATWIAEHP